MEKETRRRIMEKGSDRVALMTGGMQNLQEADSPPLFTPLFTPLISPNSHNHSYTTTHQLSPAAAAASASANTNNHLFQQSHLDLDGEDGLSMKHELSDRITCDHALMSEKTQVSNLQHDHHQLNAEEMQARPVAIYKNVEAESSSSSVIDTTMFTNDDDADVFLKSAGSSTSTSTTTLRTYFNAKEINYCILSSEDTRVFCSIMIALLVVIAYANLPRHFVKSESLIASRPLYVLLLTDVMIVILRITSTKHKDSGGGRDMKVKEAINLQEDHHNWDEAIKVMEWGLVLYQTVRAIFIDCSFYIVIIICGFSFM